MFWIVLIVIVLVVCALYSWVRKTDESGSGEEHELADAQQTYETRLVRQGNTFREVFAESSDDESDRSTIYRSPSVSLKPTSLPPLGRQRIVGEYYRKSTIELAIAGRESEVGPVGDWKHAATFDARLRLEPDNKFDRNAIAVDINGYIVGYIPKTETKSWRPLLQHLARKQQIAACIAAIYVDDDNYSIVLHCSPEHGLAENDEPEGKPLDGGSIASLLGEENAQDILNKYGIGSYVWADLKTGTIPKGKYKGQSTIWAYVDNIPVGYMTAKSCERLYESISGEIPCHCICSISQGSKKLEAKLLMAEA